jgi:hypothetical protein
VRAILQSTVLSVSNSSIRVISCYSAKREADYACKCTLQQKGLVGFATSVVLTVPVGPHVIQHVVPHVVMQGGLSEYVALAELGPAMLFRAVNMCNCRWQCELCTTLQP